jgi:RNA processing factor Prp31
MIAPRRRLTKDESRLRYRELRKVWNEFDPIGVLQDADLETDDEYEFYIGPVMRLLENEASQEEIFEYVRVVVTANMAMKWSDRMIADAERFATRCREWYRTRWPATFV